MSEREKAWYTYMGWIMKAIGGGLLTLGLGFILSTAAAGAVETEWYKLVASGALQGLCGVVVGEMSETWARSISSGSRRGFLLWFSVLSMSIISMVLLLSFLIP